MKQYKKINIFARIDTFEFTKNLRGEKCFAYKASTTQFKTCRDAKAYAMRNFKLDASQVKCNFAKK